MKSILIQTVLVVLASNLFAVPVSSWDTLERYVERTKEIVIAECLEPEIVRDDEISIATVRILEVWKGKRGTGTIKVAVLSPSSLQKGQRYLLASMGGKMGDDVDFLAHHNLYVVPISRTFPLEYYKDHPLLDKLRAVLRSRLIKINNQINELTAEKEQIQKVIE